VEQLKFSWNGNECKPLLGGSSPDRLARATEIGVNEYGYDEVNLNCGCPSAKVAGPGQTLLAPS